MKHLSSSLTFVCRQLQRSNYPRLGQIRQYRFGRSVQPSGYYISPKWHDEQLLRKPPSTSSIVGTEGLIQRANKVFDNEKQRQQSLVARTEKIEVELENSFDDGPNHILMMNAHLSTPYDCACHVSEMLTERSALAVLDSGELWHMHRPLERQCRLKLIHFKHSDPMEANYAFWRTCSMLLGSAVRKSFKDDYQVAIRSLPMSDIKSGSFVCDVSVSNLDNWHATDGELQSITALIWKDIVKNHKVEHLLVSSTVAKDLFADNQHRLALIKSRSGDDDDNGASFNVYRIGDHIEISDQPLIGNTQQIGSFHLTAIHPVHSSAGQLFYRFQGVALPRQLHINSYAFTLIRERGKKLNRSNLD